MAKIAVEFRDGTHSDDGNSPVQPCRRVIAGGNGWTVSDVVCHCGPGDRPFEERHSSATIAIVAAGTFQYRSSTGRELMTPGSLLLGNEGQLFECGHEHGKGDRCISISYSRNLFEPLAQDAGVRHPGAVFKVLRLPPLRSLSPAIAQACTALAGPTDTPWEELSMKLAVQVLELAHGTSPDSGSAEPGAVARVTRVVRMIERYPDGPHTIESLALEARLSPYHFLRMFEGVTGVTPHQYVLRVRLRQAAIRLSTETTKILDIALDCGFRDVSNFNHAFRAEFGISPRRYRAQSLRPHGRSATRP